MNEIEQNDMERSHDASFGVLFIFLVCFVVVDLVEKRKKKKVLSEKGVHESMGIASIWGWKWKVLVYMVMVVMISMVLKTRTCLPRCIGGHRTYQYRDGVGHLFHSSTD